MAPYFVGKGGAVREMVISIGGLYLKFLFF